MSVLLLIMTWLPPVSSHSPGLTTAAPLQRSLASARPKLSVYRSLRQQRFGPRLAEAEYQNAKLFENFHSIVNNDLINVPTGEKRMAFSFLSRTKMPNLWQELITGTHLRSIETVSRGTWRENTKSDASYSPVRTLTSELSVSCWL